MPLLRRSFRDATRRVWRSRCHALLAAAFTALAPSSAVAAALTPLVGWQWGGTREYAAGDVHISAAPSFGGAISAPAGPGYQLELMYTYQEAEVIGRPTLGEDFKLFDMGTHYIQIDGIRELGTSGSRATPFVLGGLGTTVFAPGESTLGRFDTQWLFSIAVGIGAMVRTSEKVALRLQSRLLVPMNFSGGSLWFGSGGGGFAVTGGTAMPQGDVSLGLTFTLGQ